MSFGKTLIDRFKQTRIVASIMKQGPVQPIHDHKGVPTAVLGSESDVHDTDMPDHGKQTMKARYRMQGCAS